MSITPTLQGAQDCTDPRPAKSSTEKELDRLMEAVSSLSCVVDQLDSRLTPVLAPVPGSAIGKESAPVAALCPLAEVVREARYRAQSVESRIRQLLEALAV